MRSFLTPIEGAMAACLKSLKIPLVGNSFSWPPHQSHRRVNHLSNELRQSV